MINLTYFPPWTMIRRTLTGSAFLLKFSTFNLGKLRKLGHLKRTENRYIRPERRYEIPVFQPEMKYCNLRQKYLRPTYCCNSHAPEIVALAYQLGAFQKSDWDFAESAFEFVKRNITIEMIPLDGVVDTLYRGTGTCLHRLSLLVALCRTSGIRTRYKLYALTYMETLDKTIDADQDGKQWNNELGSMLFHGEAEMFINEKWIVGNVGLTAERQASLGLPITKFGEVSLGKLYSAYPGTIMQLESIPYGTKTSTKVMFKMATTAADNANANLLEQCNRGRAILEAKGEKVYDEDARKVVRPVVPEINIEARREIIFKR